MRALRILQINFTSVAIGGTERNLIEYADKMTKRGHYVLTCSLDEKRGDMAREFQKRNLPFMTLDFAYSWKIIRLLKLVKLVRKLHMDIASIYGLKVQVLTAFLLRISGIRAIVAGLEGTQDWRRGYHIAIESFAHPFITRYIAVSEKVKEAFAKRERIPANKIQVIHCGVNTDNLTPQIRNRRAEIRDRLHISQDIFVIGYTSVLKPYKGHKDLLKALKILKDKGVAFKCILVGTDQMNGEIQSMCKRLDLDEDVIITGFVENLNDIIPTFDAYVSASLTEGMSVAMLEAMTIGLPVIVTPVGGTLEVIKDGENGIITPTHNPKILSEKIQNLLQDKSLMTTLSQNAIKTIQDNFSLKQKLVEREKIYYTLIRNTDSEIKN